MSSIYKRGRDGYYYYQAYIKNPLTGRVDKRIYHSLGTKELGEAKQKQEEFDKIYDNKPVEENNRKYHFKNKYIFNFFLLVSILYVVIIFLKEESGSYEGNVQAADKVGKNENASTTLERSKEENVKNKKDIILKLQDNNLDEANHSPDLITDSNPSTTSIPSYKIQRIEKIPGRFNQIKIYLTVKDSTTTSNALELICKKIKSEYLEYSNLVICLYANSKLGLDLAMGKINPTNFQKSDRTWLGMYTYNDVEGPYFDDNPTKYLGAF